MPGTFTYGLYPFPWDAVRSMHLTPSGSACVLDLRPLSEQAKSSQSSGYGLFAWASSPPGDLVSLGSGYAPELIVDNAARNELRIKLGLSANPSGATLAEVMADVLGSLADPSGASMAKPIMPTSGGVLELHLEGHSRIWSRRINAAEVLSANPKGHASRVRDVIRADLDEAERLGGAPLLQKALGAKLLGLGFAADEIAKGAVGRKGEIDRLMSAAVKAKHGANAKPKKPETSFTENFDGAYSNTLGKQLSWEELSLAGAPADNWQNANNRARYLSASAIARCTSAVSSSNNYAQAVWVASDDGANNHQAGPICRMASGAVVTGYYAAGYRYYSPDAFILGKIVSGTLTGLVSYDADISMPTTFRVSADGSSISSASLGVTRSTLTDTSISSGYLGGMYGTRFGGAVESELDDWELTDIVSGGSSSRNPSSLGMLGVG